MKPSKENIKKWVEALRSGDYQQGQCTLQDENGFCCLGVACKVFIPDTQILLENGMIYGGSPQEQPNSPGWLINVDSDFCRRTGIDFPALNDSGLGNFQTSIADIYLKPFTFDEIADLLEAIYIHEVLEV